MSFNMHDFVMKIILGMVHSEPDYKVRKYALSWYEKKLLTDEDIEKVENAIIKASAVETTEETVEEAEEE